MEKENPASAGFFFVRKAARDPRSGLEQAHLHLIASEPLGFVQRLVGGAHQRRNPCDCDDAPTPAIRVTCSVSWAAKGGACTSPLVGEYDGGANLYGISAQYRF
jgi:hypothetical protein